MEITLKQIAEGINNADNSNLARVFAGTNSAEEIKEKAILAFLNEKDPSRRCEIAMLFKYPSKARLSEVPEYIRQIQITPWKYPGVEYNGMEVEVRPSPNNKPWGIQRYAWGAFPTHVHEYGDTFSLGWGEYTGFRYGRECSCGARIEWQDIEE